MKSNRANEILQYLMRHESATVSELCDVFQVSDMTIRRDLIHLESMHQITRFHGGAVINSNELHTDVFQKRLLDNSSLKMQIGQTCCAFARKMVESEHCASIYIASGSTLYYFAKQLSLPADVALITDNIHVSNALINGGAQHIILVGGQLLLPSANSVGYLAEEMIAHFTPDIAFISTSALDADGMLYTFNLVEAGVFNAIIRSAHRIVVAADHTKLDRRNLVQLCCMDRRFTLITDAGASEEFLRPLRDRGIEVIVSGNESV